MAFWGHSNWNLHFYRVFELGSLICPKTDKTVIAKFVEHCPLYWIYACKCHFLPWSSRLFSCFFCLLFNCSLFCAFRFSSVSFPRFLNCFLSHSFSFLLPCPVLSNFVPLPLSFPFAFFYHCFLFLFRLPCHVLLFLYSVCLQYAACKGWAHMLFSNLCMHIHTLTDWQLECLSCSHELQQGRGRRNNGRILGHSILFIVPCAFPLPCSFPLASFPSFCLLPFPVSLFLTFHMFVVVCFPVPFFVPFSFVLCPFLFTSSVSFPPPSPFCCHVPFLAILSFSCSSSLCFPCPFSAIVSSSFFLLLV